MLANIRPFSFCFLIALFSCLADHLPAAEAEVPVNKLLDEIIVWAAADSDAATGRLVDCLADHREIHDTGLSDKAKEIWADLRSRTNIEITVYQFALDQLCENTRRSKNVLATRIQDLSRASKADPASDWLPADSNAVFPLLHALTEAHERELSRQGIFPGTQVIMEVKNKMKNNVVGLELVTETEATIIAGYVDERDPAFSKFISGKEKGRNQIKVTRSNLVALTNAVRDSQVKEKSPKPADKKP